MHKSWIPALVAAASILVGTASTGAQTPSIDWLTIGNPRNATDGSGFYGEVGYVYQIAKHEVTNAQYVAAGSIASATSTGTKRPISMTWG